MTHRRPWSEPERALLAQRYPDEPTAPLADALGRSVRAVQYQASKLGIGKSEAFYAAGHGQRLQAGTTVGASGRFAIGFTPWNKGKRFDVARTHPNCTAHHFKPGQMPHTWQPVGSYRLNRDGHLQRKIGNTPGVPIVYANVCNSLGTLGGYVAAGGARSA